MNDNLEGPEKSGRLTVGGWIAIAAMLAMLAWACSYAVQSWNALSGVEMSAGGWIFLVLGTVVTILVGAGLMGLIFYSSRNNFDR
jgi:hypothetical protein